MKKLKIEKSETHYRVQLDVSNYDFLEVVQGLDKRITIRFLDSRWRSVDETVEMLKEIIESLSSLK